MPKDGIKDIPNVAKNTTKKPLATAIAKRQTEIIQHRHYRRRNGDCQMDKNINQLILDCAAKVLRINQTTQAKVNFEINGHVNAIACHGFKHGYESAPVRYYNGEKYHESDYTPLGGELASSLWLDDDGAEGKLKELLTSLNALEKELIESAGTKAENTEVDNENHE